MGVRVRALGLLTLVFLPTTAPLLAGPDASLAGQVVGGKGQPLPGVTVVLRNDALAFPERGVLTDPEGQYRFDSLPPGAGYQMTLSLPGHATVVVSELLLSTGKTLTQNVTLRPSNELNEVVRVQGKSDTLDTEKVTGSTTFSSSFIAELPILGRDYQDILSLAPGVTDVNKTGNPNIHGARDTDVVTLVDGVSTTDPFTGHFGQNLNIESIQELEVITSAATAQYSRAQGGFANILTKSGGNEFQGTFKFYVRSDRLDGDGAGVENPEIAGGLQGDRAYTSQHFTDLMPFLAVSGAIVRDRLWYYLAFQYIHEETPVNAFTQAFVTPVYGSRVFGKATWQMRASQRLAFSIILDKERRENLGINSLTEAQSGYSTSRGGPTYTLRESSIFKPTVLLESALAWFDNRFSQLPTMNPDTNHNGILFVDDHPELGGNGDGILTAAERDPGEDWDGDGFYDVFEDLNHNTAQNAGEDLDNDGRFRWVAVGCEGYYHEDRNCDGDLDTEVDANRNGRLDPEEDVGISCDPRRSFCQNGTLPGTAGNARFDTEDRNGNGVLDVLQNSGYTTTPFWVDSNGNRWPDKGEYRAPLPPDRDLLTDSEGRTYGPSPYQFQDHRKRLSWIEDLSLFVADLGGTHDLRMGFAYEHEGYDSETFRRPTIRYPVAGPNPVATAHQDPDAQVAGEVNAIVGVPAFVNNTVTGDNLGIYLQDTWKPLPNLTLGLGLRFDFEGMDSFGYSHFDPAAERRAYDAAMNASGIDTTPLDGLGTVGLCQDPIHSCTGALDVRLQSLLSQLTNAAFGQLTRHNQQVEVLSRFLGAATGGLQNLSGVFGTAVRTRQLESFQITNSNLAPRLSLSWDPWGDGKTMAFGSWGRYYDKLFLNTMTLEQGPDTVSRSYEFDEDGVANQYGGDESGVADNHLGRPLSQSSLSAFMVDRSLSTPYSVEWTAGFRRELAPEVSFSLRYVHRDYHDQLQDIDLNHHIEIDPATGIAADRFGDFACIKRGGCDSTPDGAPDLYISNFMFNRVYQLGNYNEQTYRGWEIEFVRRLKRKWQMEASYTYSIAQGDAETYLSTLGNDPALKEYEPGYLAYDQRHVVKFNAVAFLPGDWRLGGTITWASGLPFSGIIHYNSVDDVGFGQSRILYGQLGVNGYGMTPEMRNIHRNPAAYLLNTRVVKNFVMGKSAASAFLEVYNLLNSDTLRVEAVDQIPAQVIYRSDHGAPVVYHPVINLVGERDFGRRFQIGFQVDF